MTWCPEHFVTWVSFVRPLMFSKIILFPLLVSNPLSCRFLSIVRRSGGRLVSRISLLWIAWRSLCGGARVGDWSHRREVGWLSMLYKIYFNPTHPQRNSLPARFVPTRVMRRVEALQNHAFVVSCCRTEQCTRTLLSSDAN